MPMSLNGTENMYIVTARLHIVSVLALFCVWTKSLMCKRCCKQGFHFQSDVKTRRNSSSLSTVRTLICLLLHSSERRVISSGHQTDQLRLDDVPLPSGHSTVSGSFLCQLAPSERLSSKSKRSSALDQSLILSKFQGRQDQSTVWTMWYSVWTNVSIRQESQFEFDRSNATQLWSGRWCIIYGN
jgi:hypothetical protein